MGLNSKDFYDLTPSELYTALTIKAHMELEEMKTQMEAARYVATHIWNASQRPLKQVELDPTKLLPFSWDKKQSVKQTPADHKNIMMGFMKRQNKKADKKKKHGI